MTAFFNLADVVGNKVPVVDIVDVGAMKVGSSEHDYAPLVKQGLGRVVGFEPVKAECDKLNALGVPNQRYLPYFIGDGGEHDFYLTNTVMTSSLYKPNTKLLRRFQNLENLTRVTEVSRVQTRRLDDIPEIAAMDYLKADIQGAELDMLRHAGRLLPGTLVIHIEVEFVEMYEGQPLFGDVDCFLRSKGFSLHTIIGPSGRCFYPFMVGGDPNKPWRQHVWADVIYVRNFMRFGELSPEQLLKTAAILHDCYKSVDLAALALQHYQAKTGEAVWDAYTKRLLGMTPPKLPLD